MKIKLFVEQKPQNKKKLYIFGIQKRNSKTFVCTVRVGMIPPSPPSNESDRDRDSGGDDDDSKPSGGGDQDPNIRFHVTLEEGDEDSVAAM